MDRSGKNNTFFEFNNYYIRHASFRIKMILETLKALAGGSHIISRKLRFPPRPAGRAAWPHRRHWDLEFITVEGDMCPQNNTNAYSSK
jgi:hypothetical protein